MAEQTVNQFRLELPFSAVLTEGMISREEAQAVIDGLRKEAAAVPEMSLDEINEEIRASRAERRRK